MELDTFFTAIEKGDDETVKKGLESGVDVNARWKLRNRWREWAPLHLAAYQGHDSICKLLISFKADIESKDQAQWTALHIAAVRDRTSTCEVLIRHGANVMARDKDQDTPLHVAAPRAWEDTAMCELLIRHGANVDAKRKDGKTPLHYVEKEETRRILRDMGYHELLKSGGEKVDRCKVVLIGNKGTGKTTLIDSMQKQSMMPALFGKETGSQGSTPGVNVVKANIPEVGGVSIWDCTSGSSNCAITHRMFLDAVNTIFLLLFNIMNQENQAQWWLSYIKSCNLNHKPKVILVATHLDLVEPDEGQYKAARIHAAMREEFKEHLCISEEVFLIDSRKSQTPQMEHLKRCLAATRANLMRLQGEIPQLCAKIIENLKGWKKRNCRPKCPVLKWPTYFDLVKAFDRFISEDFLKKCTTYLNHLGEVLFICPSNSDPIIVLEPGWLYTDVFGLIMVPENFPIRRLDRASEDFVTRAELDKVFQDIVDLDVATLLQEFQLCHSCDNQTYILPGLLKQTMLPIKWQPTTEPKVIYFGKQLCCSSNTDIFPPGFFPRVQIQLMRKLPHPPHLWRDGAKCMDRDVEGLLELSPDVRTVTICVRSIQGDKTQCRKMLQKIEDTVRDVVGDCSPATGIVEKILSARALKEHRDTFYSYTMDQISEAKMADGIVVHPILSFPEDVNNLLCKEADERLTRRRPELVQALRLVEPVLDHLLAQDILTVEDCDSVRTHRTPQDRARALLDCVGRKADSAHDAFKIILQEVNPNAAEMLI